MTESMIIIGGGPAGYTAAIYAARSDLKPLLIEGKMPGGQLTTTSEVENFPGFPKGVQGGELTSMMRAQADRFGTRFVSDEVISVDFSSQPLIVRTADGSYESQTVIIATGASATRLGIPSEQEYYGRGVSACATCDGFFFKGKKIAVVGGGDSAMEEATFLTRFAESVTVIVRKDELRASKIMQERAKANPKISFVWNSEVREVLGDGTRVTAIRLFNNKTNDIADLPIEGVFVAIGHKPSADAFKGQIELDEKGYIVTRPHSTQTNVEGVFAAGDVADPHYRQAITAAGSGCTAAIEAERFLSAREEN